MVTATDPHLLLAQWLSPAFPVGAFAYAHGLEAAIDLGHVTDADGLETWLHDLLAHGTGRSDAILIRAAAAGALEQADAEARARCASAERLAETEALGAAFCAQLRQVWGLEGPPLTYAVGFGHAVGQFDLPLTTAIAMYLHGFAGNLLSVAQRLMPLGQTEAQRRLCALTPLCDQIARDSKGATLEDISTACFAADLAAMAHETQNPRIFRT